MRDFQTKSNFGGAPDSINPNYYGAGEFNSLMAECENAVSRSGQTLTPADGSAEDPLQLAKSLFIHSSKSQTFQDSGAANTYVLTPVSGATGVTIPNSYNNLDGAVVNFIPATDNNGPSNLNIGQTVGTLIGAKALLLNDGSPLVGGEIVAGIRSQAVYDLSANSGNGGFLLTPWAVLAASGGGNINGTVLIREPQVLATDGTYIPPANLDYLVAYLVGGGAGAGSANSGGGQVGGAGGGGGGGAIRLIMAVDVAPSISYIIGAGGASATGGGTTSFGGICSATGGTPGSGSGQGGEGGVGVGGHINIRGGAGAGGNNVPSSGAGGSGSGGNGAGPFGGGGAPGILISNQVTGLSAQPNTGGGGGGGSRTAAGTQPGGAGGSGVIVIFEYGVL